MSLCCCPQEVLAAAGMFSLLYWWGQDNSPGVLRAARTGSRLTHFDGSKYHRHQGNQNLPQAELSPPVGVYATHCDQRWHCNLAWQSYCKQKHHATISGQFQKLDFDKKFKTLHNHIIKGLWWEMVYLKWSVLGRNTLTGHSTLLTRRRTWRVWFCSLSIHEFIYALLWSSEEPEAKEQRNHPGREKCQTGRVLQAPNIYHPSQSTPFSCKHVTMRKQHLYKGKTNSIHSFWKHSSTIIALD